MLNLITVIGFFLLSPNLWASIEQAPPAEASGKSRSTNMARIKALVWSGCLGHDKSDNTWYYFSKSFDGNACAFENIDLESIEMASNTSSPITLAC